MAVIPKDAATVVLMRDRRPDGGEPEVLLVRRHANANFGAGAYVFPGGMLEESDYSQDAQFLSPGLTAQAAHDMIGGLDPHEKSLGLFVAGIRETFEEVGGVLATKNGAPWQATMAEEREFASARERMYEGKLEFIPWVESLGLTLAAEELIYFAHWITPAIRPKRFDTRFFLAQVDRGVDVQTDRREVFDRVWVTPAEAAERSASGELELMRPTLANLKLLAPYATTAEAIAAMNEGQVSAILPKIIESADGGPIVLHPGDEGYDSI